jgi:hypothetical protein
MIAEADLYFRPASRTGIMLSSNPPKPFCEGWAQGDRDERE